ncbi:MAG: pilus assembly protein TadG-related protein [Candidatus Brocadiia bacterium]|jgi:hypothetical protein
MTDSNQKSGIGRFVADESGQGIIFAAATLLLLVGFVAFVFNFGRLLDRRTKTQIAADAAAYSGAMVEADAVSAIAYINSAMSQVYYNSLKYAVDMNESAVAAELERRMNFTTNPPFTPGGPSWNTYLTVYSTVSQSLPEAKQLMLQLSQLENAIAIVTPRLVQEEMFAVAGRAGGERMSVYPSFRMFPSPDSLVQFAISCLGNGWQVTNLGTGDTLTITLNGNTWDMKWISATSSREVQITQNNSTSWTIQFSQPAGTPVQLVNVDNEPNLGWVISGTGVNPNGGPPVPMQPITFTPVDPAGLGYNEGVQISQGGSSQILMRTPDGNISLWNGSSYIPMTSNTTTIGGVNVQVNVTNTINFAGGGSAQIGNPSVLNIGGARIVLSNPPTIGTGFGPVWINITGFNPNQFNISAGGFSLMPGNSNGRWNDHYNPAEELWWRNRLVVMGTDANGNPNQWEYDWEQLGALLQAEPQNGNITAHAFMGSGNGYTSDPGTWPTWTGWFNPFPYPMPNNPTQNYAMPYDISTQAPQDPTWFGPPDGKGISHLLSQYAAPVIAPQAYYQTAKCAYCNGTGMVPGTNVVGSCPVCHGWDNAGNLTYSNVRVFIGDLATSVHTVVHLSNPAAQIFPDDFYLSAPMFRQTSVTNYPNPSSPGVAIATPGLPLVAYDDFFKWGVNVGVWKHPYNGLWTGTNGGQSDNLMLSNVQDPLSQVVFFPSSVEPAWGTVAVASARVGLPVAIGGLPNGGVALPNVNGSYLCQFSDAADRSAWCQSSLENLYYADVQAQLFASKNQVGDFDLDEAILQGTPVAAIDESGLSYLWSAILAQNSYNYRNDWMNRFNGEADPRIGQALRNMQDRQGATFDYGSGNLNQVVQH